MERLVEGGCAIKHTTHVIVSSGSILTHFYVPIIEGLVEGACVTKHKSHIPHIGHVPIIAKKKRNITSPRIESPTPPPPV